MLKSRFLIQYKLHHIFFWLLVLGIWFFLRSDDYDNKAIAFKITIIKVADLALMIYIVNLLFIPYLLYKKRYFLFTICFIILIVASSLIKMKILGGILNIPQLENFWKDPKGRIYDNIIPHFFLVIAGAAVKLMLDYGKLQQRMAETAREKAEAELNFLKSQINPHFLFNSLNSVYFLINKENTEARQALHKFSDMLRYQLYEANGEKIPIEKEIRYLEDYMDLQKLRKDEQYTVSFTRSPEIKGFVIEPLLLIPFVENAFKHISHHSNEMNFVKVDMNFLNDSFVFCVENSREQQPVTDRQGGIGLSNVKRRLELLYPGKHDLSVTKTEKTFVIKLNLHIV